MQPYDFAVCKLCAERRGAPAYHLKGGLRIYECAACGFHYLNYLDDLHERGSAREIQDLRKKDFDYIDRQLQGNAARFSRHVNILKKHRDLSGARCLDVGAGGGMFLHLLRSEGADVFGIEPSNVRRAFAREKYQLLLSSTVIEDPDWLERHANFFDIVTLWDVIEHVNFPAEVLRAAYAVTKPGGLLFLDTPARDSFYYRTGELSYRFTGGRYPTFLNMLYSNTPFAHKQIFESNQLRMFLVRVGYNPISLYKIHELSFPYEFYLKKVVKSEPLVKLCALVVAALFMVVHIRNKIMLVAHKPLSSMG